MSRVDEALRRAREQDGEASGADSPADMAGLQTEDPFGLALEPVVASGDAARPAARPAARSARQEAVRAAPVRPAPEASRPSLPAPRLIERMDSALAEKTVIDANMLATSREQYRRLAASLHHMQAATGLKVVMIGSAAPGEGKTLTAANLGLTFSESYKRTVLLIDADLRRPALHRVFGTDNASGLTEGLSASAERRLPVRQISQRLSLLQAGQPSADPMAGLTSERMRRLISEARELFDWVIIDSPPVALLPDANLLGAMADGAIVVVKAGATPYELVLRAIETIGRQRILGVVLNRAETVPHGYGYEYYNSYYATTTPESLPGS